MPEPTGRHSVVRAVDEAPEVATVRRLLCELRPETDGPLGWGPYDLPPGESVTTPTCRVQNGVADSEKHGGIPKGAFARPEVDRLTQARRRISWVTNADPDAGAVLVHLQLRGTLAHGYGALCVGVAHAVAAEDRRERWRADAARAWDRARIWGARRVELAAVAWARSAEAVGGVDIGGPEW